MNSRPLVLSILMFTSGSLSSRPNQRLEDCNSFFFCSEHCPEIVNAIKPFGHTLEKK